MAGGAPTYLVGRGFVHPGYKPRFERGFKYSVERLELEVRIDPGGRRVEGSATYLIDCRDGFVELDAVDLEILGVLVNGAEAGYHYDGRALVVETGGRGRVKLTVRYVAKPRKGLYFIDKDERGLGPFVWSQGESEDNRYWVPLPDHPSMKFPCTVRVRAPRGLTVVSNGVLEERVDEGNDSLWVWRLDKPQSPYLIAIAAGVFDVVRESSGGVELEYYVPKGLAGVARYSFHKTGDMIRFFEEYLGVPYPWPNYKQVAVPEFIYGGMENTTVTILTDTTLHDEHAHCPGGRFPCHGLEDFTSDRLVAHELAHQWFGDLVTARDWPHIWLNEAFATYLEALYTRHSKGEDEFVYEMVKNLEEYLDEYKRYSRPIVTRFYEDPEELFDAHSYEKGALVLHTLRSVIGDDVFRRALGTLLTRFSFKSIDTEDFRKVVEEAWGEPLDWFFQQYVYSSGHPRLRYQWSYDPAGGSLKLRIEQTQPEDSYPEYKLSLDVLIVLKDGREVVRKVGVEERTAVYYFSLGERPAYVVIDPWFRVLKEAAPEKGLEEALAQLRDPRVYPRIEAIKVLERNASPRAVEAIGNTLLNDSFWGVRAEAARALGRVGGEAALRTLMRALDVEKHPRVRQAIAEALGGFKRSREAADRLLRVLLDRGESYYTRQRAASSLGKLGLPEYKDWLVKALGYHGHNHSITRGALEGLAELGGEDSLKIILEYSEDEEKPTLVRAAATRHLSKLIDKPRAAQALKRLLRDEKYRVRRAAVDAVAETLSPQFLDELERASKEDPDGRIRRRARDVARLIKEHMEKGVEYARLREEVEALRREYGRLQEQLGRVERKTA